MSVFAQEGGFMPWTDVMMEADADGSGGVSMAEIKSYRLGKRFQGFQPWMSDHFAELDTNGDGEVNLTELKKGTMEMEMGDAEVSSGFYRGFGFMPANQ
ncbi:MAG: hypothetical protein ACNYPG_02330 [Candidatus Porifericomitaceae bacterium WSBS_2022_MAG_OTU9]